MTATETVTCIIATERSTNITVIETTTCIVSIEPQNLDKCNTDVVTYLIAIKSVSFIVPTEIATCRIDYIYTYRNFYLQK